MIFNFDRKPKFSFSRKTWFCYFDENLNFAIMIGKYDFVIFTKLILQFLTK